MLTAHHIGKSFNIFPILQDISFSINAGDRVGLIGPNGCGKTTLLKILAGLEPADQGVVTAAPPSLRIGYLRQGFDLALNESLGGLIQKAIGDPLVLAAEVERLALALANQPDSLTLQNAYDIALRQIQAIDPLDAGRAHAILAALGLADMPDDWPVTALSGGQKTRLGLALVLLNSPELLLLDEPTNHLDIEMLEWLEGWLNGFQGAVLMVSHDRTFLDQTVNRILDLDPGTHTLREYVGNYTAYLEQYQAICGKQASAYADQVYEIRRMKQDINRAKQQSLKVELSTTPRQPGVRRIAKKVARKALAREKKLDRYLDSDDRVERVRESWQIKTDIFSPEFGAHPHHGQDVLKLENLAVGYPGHPALLMDVNLYVRAGRRIAITGPNGAGKTSLLRTIAGRLAPLSGAIRLGANVRLGYMTQEQESLPPERNAVEIIHDVAAMSETEVRSFLHYFLFTGDEPLRQSRALSYGERARLSLAVLVAQGCNFLLLDEPINHLDIPSRERFEQALAHFEGTVLAVVHDRYFIERFADDAWVVRDRNVAALFRISTDAGAL